FSADEYEAPEPAGETGRTDTGADDEFPELPDWNDEELEARLRSRRDAMNENLNPALRPAEQAPMSEMLGLFATAVNKMSEAIDNLGSDRGGAEAARQPKQEPAEPRSEALEALEARVLAQSDELRRLREENAALRVGAEQARAAAAAPAPSPEPEEIEQDDFSEEADSGALFDLLLGDDEESEDDFFSTDDDFFPDEDDETAEEDSLSFQDDTDEDEALDAEDEPLDGEEDEDEEDVDDEDDDDILSSFFSFSNELKTMTVFEKMRFDGRTVEPISLEALEGLAEAQKERRRRERLNSMAQNA
ncbi:MAG: hypothetical protein IIT62_07085, partial [Oscillospiraceae bacterium]|nr:hypothetical protein [Oscillospiraceae bacterium]